MRTINLTFLATFMAFAGMTAFAADPVGTIVSINGKATAKFPDGALRNLELKAPVFLNDRIETEAAASLQIMFLDDSVISQGAKSEMTIDEYVYNPKVKEDNKCTVNLTKGFFRAVTARITTLNPDRFKVKTRLATIGIRGCELAFSISQASENVYVLSLPDGKSINVTINPDAAAGMNLTGVVNKDAAIEIIQAGTMISIQEGEGVIQRFITNQEALDLIEQLIAPDGPGNLPPPPDDNPGAIVNTVIDDITSLANQEYNQQFMEETKEEIIAGIQEVLPETPETVVEEIIEAVASLVYTTKGTGMDWEWGVWSYPDAVPQSVQFQPYSTIPDATVAGYFDAGGYSLETSGMAASIVSYNGNSYFVTGPCSINVNILPNTPPGFWDVSGSLTDGAAGTVFSMFISGLVTAEGQFIGELPFDSNELTVGGQNFPVADMSGSSASARLTGSGVPTGIIGSYICTFGNGAAMVQGGFGGDDMP